MKEGMMKKQSCVATTTSSSSLALSMHKDSRTISKPAKPKIRIIHIFAPEIIKTDVANFRELVQALTGKPTERNTKKKPTFPGKSEAARALNNYEPAGLAMKMEMRTGFRSSGFRERNNTRNYKGGEKEEEGLWCGDDQNSSAGGFLGGFFSDLDGFMQEINGFPFMIPLDASNMDALGERQLQ
ncbi:hypothetical protein U1Q18_012760 [Sarracenia purpurea var. burkii]